MSNIVRFHPKPATLAVDYGTPLLRPGSRLEIWKQTYRLIHRTATGNHNIQNVDTGDIETLGWIEYVVLWKAGELRILEAPGGLSPRKERLRNIPLDVFTPEQQAIIERNKHYCKAVKDALIDGTLKNTGTPAIDTWIENGGLSKPKGYEEKKLLSRGQIQKLYSVWKASGERDSALAHGNCFAPRKSDLHEDVVDIIYDVIETFALPNSKFSLENVQTEISNEINRRIADGELEVDEEEEQTVRVPSLPTIAAYKRRIEQYVVVRIEDGEYEAQMKNAPKGKVLIPQYPGARWELDHALLPIPVCVECIGPNGDLVRIRVGKVWVTIVIDVATRFVLAMIFGIDPPSSARTLAALKMAMTSKAEIFEKYGIENRLDVCIVPTLIVFDNGKDLHSADVLATTGDLNVIHAFAGAYHGDHKPYVERFIRTAKAFLRKTPGATDKGQRTRGPKRKDIPEPKPIPIEEVERIAWKWLMDTYHVKPHSGLWKDKPANVMKRGLERLMANRKKSVPLPFRPTMSHYTALECDAMFAIRLVRPVDPRGVRYKYLWWNSGELGRMISETRCKEVHVRLDPANLGSVLVLHPTRFDWIRVPCLYPFYAEGLSLWHHQRILSRIHEHERKQKGGKRGRNFSIDIRKYLQNEGELLAELIDLAGMKKPSVAQARHAARFLGSKLDFALGVARMDAIDIHMGKKPPGYGALINLVKAPDGTYYAESKPNPKANGGRFDYRAAETIVDPEAPEPSNDDMSPSMTNDVDMTTNPIAGFDPNGGLK
jgi:hypothetical protein